MQTLSRCFFPPFCGRDNRVKQHFISLTYRKHSVYCIPATWSIYERTVCSLKCYMNHVITDGAARIFFLLCCCFGAGASLSAYLRLHQPAAESRTSKPKPGSRTESNPIICNIPISPCYPSIQTPRIAFREKCATRAAESKLPLMCV